MAGDMNVVAMVGRLVRESEIRYSQNGGAICRFSIAVNRRKRVGDRWEDEANFFDCVYFGKAAESVNQYLTKGRQVSIVGELHQSRWEQDGQTRSRVEIYINNLTLLSSGNGQEGQSSNNNYSRPQNSTQTNDYGAQNNRYGNNGQNYQRNDQPIADDFGPESYADDGNDVPF